jgi:hypothetical protein
MLNKVVFILILISCFTVHAQEEEAVESIVLPAEAIEYLEQCTEENRESVIEQYIEKQIYESNKLSTEDYQQMLQEKVLNAESFQPPSQKSINALEMIIADPDKVVPSPISMNAIYVDYVETSEKDALGPSQYDSRIDLHELSPLIEWQRKILDNSRSVGIIIDRTRLSDLTDTIYLLDISTKLKDVFQLCPEEPYGDQLSLGVGTAFIIDSETMMTASHVFEGGIENYVVLFNFETINRQDAIYPFVTLSNVYEIEEIISENSALDIISFKVNKPLKGTPLKLATQNTLTENESIYMIGHPSGLPKKVALNASVYKNNDAFHFYTTLDAFQGNSGSPVFDMKSHTVIGVLVSGLQDYHWTGNCNESNLCYFPYCKGEKVMRIEQIMND